MTARRCDCPSPGARPPRRRAALALSVAAALALALAACASSRPPINAAQQSAQNAAQVAARAWNRGDAVAARQAYEQALAAAESVEDAGLAASMLLNLALVQSHSGDLAGAHARLDRIVGSPQRYGAPWPARASARKALLLMDQQDLDAALAWADRAQAACTAPCELAAALADLRAHAALQRGDLPATIAQARLAAQAAELAWQGAEQANALRLLGRAQSRQGLGAEAAASLAQALAIDRRLGLPERIALDLLDAGDHEAGRSQTASARELYERALVVAQAAGLKATAEALRARMAALPAR